MAIYSLLFIELNLEMFSFKLVTEGQRAHNSFQSWYVLAQNIFWEKGGGGWSCGGEGEKYKKIRM